MRTYPFLSNYLQSSGWELTSSFPESGCTSLYGLDGALHNRSFVQAMTLDGIRAPGLS